MLATELTQEQRLRKAFFDIVNSDRYKYMSPILLLGETRIIDVNDIPTACTDGLNIVYNRTFLGNGCPQESEVRGLILHENKHKEGRHPFVYQHLYRKDARCANLACDYVINLQILDENKDGFATLPKGGAVDERFRGMTVTQVFNILYREGEGGDGGSGKGKEGDEKGEGTTTGCSSNDTGETLDEHDWESVQEMTEDERNEALEKIDSAVREGAVLAGKTGGNLNESLQELLEPKVDWVKCMAAFAREQCAGDDDSTYAKPNRRWLSSGIIMPSSISETIPELCVSMDTSGSCWPFLPYFLGELKSMCTMLKPHVLHVMFWDTNVVYEKYVHNQLDDLEIKEAYGGGGTDVNCVTAYMKEHNINPTATIILTDGYLSDGWGEWACPTFWLLVNNKKDRPPFGKYVHVEDF
mgnify:CR=1 FL=1